MRIGHGYDTHRLVPGRKLILGGIDIPFERGLLGHSDADVLVHSVIDALLGAAAMGDIGTHFPADNSKYKDADSIELLKDTASMLRAKGYKIGNIDATLIIQNPKIAPYIVPMREKIAGALELELDRVSVKATTEEGMGFTGTGEGISAHAVVLLHS
ncbi:MAG: 2-C-methyl-D-erythritol 2,4-cyclodiphosphate synthase [Oscillospiraceae bacterium]|nr:2-C-methyl-D-erythritol 2,4-cyclodiphosphate synthase [Oscillospiraceae bacterium]